MNCNLSCASIFCDDIRHEINGKMSLMGVYGDIMYVPDFPITISKICAFFELRVRPDRIIGGDATITVMKGADKIGVVTLAIPSFEDSPKAQHGKPFVYGRFAGAMEFPAMTFSEPVLLEILAQFDGESAVGGRLWVTRLSQDNQAPAAAV